MSAHIEGTDKHLHTPGGGDQRASLLANNAEVLRGFMDALYPPRFNLVGYQSLTTKANGFASLSWHPLDEPGRQALIEQASERSVDVYFHCATHDAQTAGNRGRDASAQELAFIWADIDVAEANKANGRRYPTSDLALKMLDQLPLPPSIIVDSGNGFHAYWLLDEPLDAQQYPELVGRWQVYLQQQLNHIGKGNANGT